MMPPSPVKRGRGRPKSAKRREQPAEVGFDPKLGGDRGHGTKFREVGTGKLAPRPAFSCPDSPTGTHFWLMIDAVRGHCKFCPKKRNFGAMQDHIRKHIEEGRINPADMLEEGDRRIG